MREHQGTPAQAQALVGSSLRILRSDLRCIDSPEIEYQERVKWVTCQRGANLTLGLVPLAEREGEQGIHQQRARIGWINGESQSPRGRCGLPIPEGQMEVL